MSPLQFHANTRKSEPTYVGCYDEGMLTCGKAMNWRMAAPITMRLFPFYWNISVGPLVGNQPEIKIIFAY